MEKDEERLVKGLGWFSVGLGLAELLAPGSIANLIGAPDTDGNRTLLRGLGLRELTAGVGILSDPASAGWLWSRVAGDAMDLGLLGTALSSEKSQRGKVAAATASVVGVTLLDVYAANLLNAGASKKPGYKEDGSMEVKKSITIDRAPEELYAFWRNFENLPRIMNHLESVKTNGDGKSHWKAKAPAGATVEWDAEVTEDTPNQRIAWKSTNASQIENSGVVTFTPATGGRGTVVRVQLQYSPPLGVIGATVAKLLGEEPNIQVYDDLRAFKQVMELGEVVKSDGSLEGGHIKQHPGQPAA